MPPKIPQLSRENATLREATPGPQDQEAGTNQKIPQTHPPRPKKVWWDVQKKDPQHDESQKG